MPRMKLPVCVCNAAITYNNAVITYNKNIHRTCIHQRIICTTYFCTPRLGGGGYVCHVYVVPSMTIRDSV